MDRSLALILDVECLAERTTNDDGGEVEERSIAEDDLRDLLRLDNPPHRD